MQTQHLVQNCGSCGYEITSPTCVDCLRKQAISFIGDEAKQDVMEIMEFSKFLNESSNCIHCKAPVTICNYCFNKEVKSLLIDSSEFDRLFQCDEELQDYFNHYFSFNSPFGKV